MGKIYLVRVYISEGILKAVVNLNDVRISNSGSSVDDGLKREVGKKLSQIEEAFFNKPPNSMSRCTKYDI